MGNIDCCDRRKIPFLNQDHDSKPIPSDTARSKKPIKRSEAKHSRRNKNTHKPSKNKKRSSSSDSNQDSLDSSIDSTSSVFQKPTVSHKLVNKSRESYSSPYLKPGVLSDSPKFKSVKSNAETDRCNYSSQGKNSSGKLETIEKVEISDKVNTLLLNEFSYVDTKSSKFHISASAIKQEDDVQSLSKFSNFTVSEPDSESLSGNTYDINTYSRRYGIIEESSREYIESNSEYYEPDSRQYINEEGNNSIPLNSESLQEISEDEDEAAHMLLEAPDYRLDDILDLSTEEQISVSWVFKAYAQVNKFPQEEEEVDGFLIVKKKSRFNSMKMRFLLFSTRGIYIMKKRYLKDVRRRIDLTDIASLTLAHDEQSFVIHVKSSDSGVDVQLFTDRSKDAVNSIKTLVFLLVQDFPRIFKPTTKQEFAKLIKSDEVREDSTSKDLLQEEIRTQMGRMFANI